jgi:hypothetical protein
LKKSKLSNLKRNRQIGKAFLYISDKYQYFVHEIRDSSNTVSRHLIITDKQSEKIIIERSFIDGESMSAAPLNYGIDNPDFADSKEQWTGKLLKDKPDVIFGFDWVSFGCPNIIFLHSSFDDIYLNCDNRH